MKSFFIRHSFSLAALTSIVFMTTTSVSSAQPLNRLIARVHCYTEIVDLPAVDLRIRPGDLPTDAYRAEGLVGHLGNLEIFASISLKNVGNEFRLCSGYLGVARDVNGPDYESGSGSFYSDANDCFGLPSTKSFILDIGNRLVEPYDFDPDVACRVQLIIPATR